jgi:ADP-ribose pyrophosphatase YjhB (NUDIX family)
MSKRERFKLSVSVFMILIDGTIVLTIKRGNTGWMDGFYSVPAGGVDGGNPLMKEVIRETKEEINVTIKEQDITLIHTMHNVTEKDEWIGAFFMTNKWEGQPIVNEPHKHTEVKWVEMDELPENTIPYVKQAIDAMKNKKSYSEYGWE